jgi:hypothetical protein
MHARTRGSPLAPVGHGSERIDHPNGGPVPPTRFHEPATQIDAGRDSALLCGIATMGGARLERATSCL